ncbi:hypothetical protein [Pseudoteredinibacter isoporae]|uniref:Uncharacterized protein n=1 Tax=Pseudoteredinibacter isoporae TaxID=570281 RepID=A0A7X0JVB5_9GAMM|nr:hypothetical protein [Pseudoteredinibacter isoporae]MBB6522100.1 hypothetical protein [Pseudoteredinibacter isoporae]NHO87635.1 hypothetical protein [Pseudoteredinibacter isoporae]NIB24034.1 hypothetical protein [Pseudoteredinibacter isoporae]
MPVVDLSQFPGATRRRGMDLDNAPVNSCYSEHNVALKRLPEQVAGSLSVARDTRNEIPAQHKDVKKPVLTREGSYV